MSRINTTNHNLKANLLARPSAPKAAAAVAAGAGLGARLDDKVTLSGETRETSPNQALKNFAKTYNTKPAEQSVQGERNKIYQNSQGRLAVSRLG